MCRSLDVHVGHAVDHPSQCMFSLDSNEGLRRFQAGELPENDEEWHRLVPKSALDVIEKREIQRQSVIFEIIKSERDYVRDLELVRDVYVDPLLNTSPIPQQRMRGYVNEVFGNLDDILLHHRLMLNKLFELQRDQHPLITNFASIILDSECPCHLSLLLLTPVAQLA